MMSDFHIERDDASAPFFDAARDGRLLIRRCPTCGELYPPHQHQCPDGSDLEWVDAAGTGTLITWTVDHGAGISPELTSGTGDGEVIGIVELAEGPWLHTAIPGVDPAALTAGLAMRVEFLPLGGGEPVPTFVPAG
jgi:uncharacterized OB-fold protein